MAAPVWASPGDFLLHFIVALTLLCWSTWSRDYKGQCNNQQLKVHFAEISGWHDTLVTQDLFRWAKLLFAELGWVTVVANDVIWTFKVEVQHVYNYLTSRFYTTKCFMYFHLGEYVMWNVCMKNIMFTVLFIFFCMIDLHIWYVYLAINPKIHFFNFS